MTHEKQEPASRQDSPWLFRIGRNSRGHWVAQDQYGLRGGLFVDRNEALRFALSENGDCPCAVLMVPGVLELDMRPKSLRGRPPAGDVARENRAA
jgi:hypothetical protein